MLITIKHVRECGLCALGCQQALEKYGFNWQEFVVKGIDSDLLLATNDPILAEHIPKLLEAEKHKDK